MTSKIKKALINVFIGKMNNYFNLWLKSCEYNKSYTFLLFTDDTDNYQYPNNVVVHHITFEEIKKIISKKYNFEIVLDRPYKLCDYKVAYGDIFYDYIKDYDYWGYCDLDVIFGNLDKILPDELISKYDKISERGHFSLYKNTKQIRNAYKLKLPNCLYYQDVFSSPKIFGFDESWFNNGVNHILINSGYKVMLRPILFADIMPFHFGLRNIREAFESRELQEYEKKKKRVFFLYNKGNLIQYYLFDGQIGSNEELYIHFYKRRMKNKTKSDNHYLIVPQNKIIDINKNYLKKLFFYKIRENYYLYQKIGYYLTLLKKRLKKKHQQK